MYPLAQTPNSIQLCACGNVRIDHQKMELFLLPFLMDGTEKHTAGFNTHHGSQRRFVMAIQVFPMSSSGS